MRYRHGHDDGMFLFFRVEINQIEERKSLDLIVFRVFGTVFMEVSLSKMILKTEFTG